MQISYCNVDYCVASALASHGRLARLVLSYDIMCQWWLHFLQRMKKLPPTLQLTLPSDTEYVIPKYHYNAHREKDHTQYSLNYMPGAGSTCCEQIECNWPKHEETAASTREMGPRCRHDTLEDHFGYANWHVYASLGESSLVSIVKGAYHCS